MSETLIHHDEHRDDEASKLGIWLFIFTELLFFGGLFVTYAVYRHAHPQAFHLAAQQLLHDRRAFVQPLIGRHHHRHHREGILAELYLQGNLCRLRD